MDVTPRIQPTIRPADERIGDYREIYATFGAEEAVEEASRCLGCAKPMCEIKGCPLTNHIRDWNLLTAEGKFAEAAALTRVTSSMPEICSRVCPQEKLCEGACTLGRKFEPVAIGQIEKFLNDWAKENNTIVTPNVLPSTGKSVGVVGSGPAGFAVADLCIQAGHSVTVYDMWPTPGGLLLFGLPAFKLEKHHILERWEELIGMGVEFVPNTYVGKDVTISQLLEKHDALALGNGSLISKNLRVEGEDLPGIFDPLDVLAKYHVEEELQPDRIKEMLLPLDGKNVVVLGGGDSAMDCLRTAIREGAASVTCVYRRDADNMPGSKKEYKRAIEEGVVFKFYSQPVSMVAGEDGNIATINCIEMELGEPDDSGRRRPVPKPNSDFTFDCDVAIKSLGFDPDAGLLEGADDAVSTVFWGGIEIDEESGRTSHPRIFAAGDTVTGADLVVTAVAAGRRAARSINRLLGE